MGDREDMTSPADMDVDLLEVKSTAQACIMHALRIVSYKAQVTNFRYL